MWKPLWKWPAFFCVVRAKYSGEVRVVFGVAICFVGEDLSPEVVVARCRVGKEVIEVRRHDGGRIASLEGLRARCDCSTPLCGPVGVGD